MNRQGTYTQELRNKAVELYTIEKFGCDYIAKVVGFSQFTVLKNLRKDGVKIRTAQEAYSFRIASTPQERAEKEKGRTRKSNKNYRHIAAQKNQEFIVQFLLGNCCLDCGYDNILALEFDHRDPTQKSFTISTFLSKNGCTKEVQDKVREEIAKCDLVCSNCHAIRTAKRFGSWRLRYMQEVLSDSGEGPGC